MRHVYVTFIVKGRIIISYRDVKRTIYLNIEFEKIEFDIIATTTVRAWYQSSKLSHK